ncbi:hypothetical protein CAEBREN_17664 [Caenorhabditis brenneri]|uniref:Uncharacterized protein n=1 Tax=Caenorhabditis brenneri TaxID=135651 RepID=G0NTM6_CAEBE|nr:hypothetical protein CAEBREN_17664 [Caenorhabditis brenneri]
MKTIVLLLVLTILAFSYPAEYGLGLAVKAGHEDLILAVRASEPKAYTRVLKNGEKQTWNLSGPNKGTWIDAKGNKIPSSHFVFIAPNTLKIKKVTKEDAGIYDYIPLHEPVKTKLPKGVHIDPILPSGFKLDVN